MTLELSALPLAFLAGVVGILSPCVWPLVPVVLGSAANGSRVGPIALAFGLSIAFAIAGTLLSFILVNTGTDPEFFRYIAAMLLLLAGLVLVIRPVGEWFMVRLSLLTSRFHLQQNRPWFGPFGVGLLLGLIWLPCVGPTLGAAIALASMGQQMLFAFWVMLMFGAGTASVLLAASLLTGKALSTVSGPLLAKAIQGKKLLGWMLLLLGVFVLTGFDKTLQTWALIILPEWSTSF